MLSLFHFLHNMFKPKRNIASSCQFKSTRNSIYEIYGHSFVYLYIKFSFIFLFYYYCKILQHLILLCSTFIFYYMPNHFQNLHQYYDFCSFHSICISLRRWDFKRRICSIRCILQISQRDIKRRKIVTVLIYKLTLYTC